MREKSYTKDICFLTVMPSPYQREFFRAIRRYTGLDISVMYYTLQPSDRDWKEAALEPYEQVLPGRTFHRLGNSAHWNPSIIQEIKNTQARLYIISDYSAPTAQVAMRYLTWRRIPWMFWGELPGMRSRGWVGRWLRRKLQAPIKAGALGIVGVGSRAVDAYKKLFPNTKLYYNIPYFCDLQPFMQTERQQNHAANTVSFLFSGQLIHRKGCDVLIRAFIAAERQISGLSLTLLGDGPDRQQLQEMVPEQFLEKICFAGFKQSAQLPEYFAQADVFVMPSRHDGWGVVVNEAIGAGLPVIISKGVGAGCDLVAHERNGFVYEPEDVEGLKKAIIRLGSSADLRQQMRKESSEIAKNWTLEAGARKWGELYNDLKAKSGCCI